MRKADMNCHRCGSKGHFESECPYAAIASDGKPPWCGFCDEWTRLIDHGSTVSRCQECHPLARQQLKQHRKCPHCHVTVYDWDHGDCGSHSGPAIPDRRPEREHIKSVIAGGRTFL